VYCEYGYNFYETFKFLGHLQYNGGLEGVAYNCGSTSWWLPADIEGANDNLPDD